MKVLIIYGGTRLGNTWKATLQVKEELKNVSEDIAFEEILLKDLNLPYCQACSQCFRKGHSYCPHHGIMQMIMDKIEESDAVIISAPTYNRMMPALMKNLVDHLCFVIHRPRYFKKVGLIVTTTGGVGAKDATKYMASTLIGWGFNRCYQLPLVSGSWNDYKPTEKDRKKTAAVIKRFYKDAISEKKHSPLLVSVLCFNLFRGMGTHYVEGTEYAFRDGAFWQQEGYAGQTYSPKVQTPFYKKIFGAIIFLVAKKVSKKTIVTYKKQDNKEKSVTIIENE